MLTNRLATAPGTYLRSHANDPVHWQLWDEEAFSHARTRQVPILLSVGYAACHWCHVMARESFSNPAIASLLNEHFICIKVDREVRPDVDAMYMRALSAMGQAGGWPLTMFLTPDLQPFSGGTYFPPSPRMGMPSLRMVLEAIITAWRDERTKLNTNAEALGKALPMEPTVGASENLSLGEAAKRCAGVCDSEHGGIGRAPKFPHTELIRLMLREPTTRTQANAALEGMMCGGIHDHLGGGFARYTVDRAWHVPHFEKMLYDNALLLRLFAEAHCVLPSPRLTARTEALVAWLEKEMLMPKGGLAASLDADQEGREGLFYLWDEETIHRELGNEDASRFLSVYELTPVEGEEGKVLVLKRTAPWEEEEALEPQRAKLLHLRGARTPPPRDSKVVTAWHGLTVAGLAHAGFVHNRSAWIELATEWMMYAATHLAPPKGKAWRAICAVSGSAQTAFAEDLAALVLAASYLAEARPEARWFEMARAWVEILGKTYGDEEGVLFDSPKESEIRLYTNHDGATPAPAAMLGEACARLFLLTHDPYWLEQTEKWLTPLKGVMTTEPLMSGGAWCATHTYMQGASLSLMSSQEALLATARTSPPGTVVRLPNMPHSPHHPAGAPDKAMVCVHNRCLMPTDDAQALRAQLAEIFP